MFKVCQRNTIDFSTFINEEKGVVAVRINNGLAQLLEELDLFYAKNGLMFDVEFWREFCDKYKKQVDKIVGLATCNYSAGDLFDVNFGHNLAKERALMYFENYRTKMFTMLCLKYDDFAEKASKRAEASDCRRAERIDAIYDQIDSIKL